MKTILSHSFFQYPENIHAWSTCDVNLRHLHIIMQQPLGRCSSPKASVMTVSSCVVAMFSVRQRYKEADVSMLNDLFNIVVTSIRHTLLGKQSRDMPDLTALLDRFRQISVHTCL